MHLPQDGRCLLNKMLVHIRVGTAFARYHGSAARPASGAATMIPESSTPSWDALPNALRVRIFRLLDLNSKLQAERTCRAWRSLLIQVRRAPRKLLVLVAADAWLVSGSNPEAHIVCLEPSKAQLDHTCPFVHVWLEATGGQAVRVCV